MPEEHLGHGPASSNRGQQEVQLASFRAAHGLIDPLRGLFPAVFRCFLRLGAGAKARNEGQHQQGLGSELFAAIF